MNRPMSNRSTKYSFLSWGWVRSSGKMAQYIVRYITTLKAKADWQWIFLQFLRGAVSHVALLGFNGHGTIEPAGRHSSGHGLLAVMPQEQRHLLPTLQHRPRKQVVDAAHEQRRVAERGSRLQLHFMRHSRFLLGNEINQWIRKCIYGGSLGVFALELQVLLNHDHICFNCITCI